MVAVPILLAGGTPAVGPSAVSTSEQFSTFYILAALRVPHHYLPLSFPPGDYARFGLVVLAGGAALIFLRRRNRLWHGTFAVHFLTSIALLAVLAFIFTELFPTLLVAQLQLFKLTVLATMLLVVLACHGVVALLPDRATAWGGRLLEKRRLGLAVVGAAIAATAALAAAGVGRPYAKLQPAVHRASDEHAVEEWVRAQTDLDALFLVPPSNTTFRTYAHRSVVINHKPVPFQKGEMHVWLERLLTVAPASLPERGTHFVTALDSAYYRNTRADWQRLADIFGADYVLAESKRLAEAPAEVPEFTAGRWSLYRLRQP